MAATEAMPAKKLIGPFVPVERGNVPAMGLCYQEATITHVTGGGGHTATYLVDSGAINSVVAEDVLEELGVEREGAEVYEMADGSRVELDHGFARITVDGHTTAGIVIFGPAGTDGLLGVTVLESLGLALDPKNNRLIRLSAISLK